VQTEGKIMTDHIEELEELIARSTEIIAHADRLGVDAVACLERKDRAHYRDELDYLKMRGAK